MFDFLELDFFFWDTTKEGLQGTELGKQDALFLQDS